MQFVLNERANNMLYIFWAELLNSRYFSQKLSFSIEFLKIHLASKEWNIFFYYSDSSQWISVQFVLNERAKKCWMFSSGVAVSFPHLNYFDYMWDSFDRVWSIVPMCGVVLLSPASLIGWRPRLSALLMMLV